MALAIKIQIGWQLMNRCRGDKTLGVTLCSAGDHLAGLGGLSAVYGGGSIAASDGSATTARMSGWGTRPVPSKVPGSWMLAA